MRHLIYDALQNAPLYESEAFSIFPIEMVYAVVEVKTDISKRRLGKTELDDCMEKCAYIRGMAHESITEDEFETLQGIRNTSFLVTRDQKQRPIKAFKGYFRQVIEGKVQSVTIFNFLAPRFFIFSYKGWKTARAIEENFATIGAQHPKAHIHGVCIRNDDGGYYTGHKAFKTGSAKNQTLIEKDGFVHFLLGLPTMLETMLPPFPQRLGAGFDLVDLHRYHILSEEFQKNALGMTEHSSD